MEICILKFDASRDAENALKEVSDTKGDRNPWLYDIGVLSRPLVGRVRVSASFPDGKSKTFHEGDLADAVADLGAYTGYFVSALAGPLGQVIGAMKAATVAGAVGGEAEQRLLHLDEIKKALPRDSSVLVLVATPQICDAMVDAFKSYKPKVVRTDVADELQQRLQGLHERLAQQFTQQLGASAH